MILGVLIATITVVAVPPIANASVITNPSFEAEHIGTMPLGQITTNPYYNMPDDWNWDLNGFMNGHGIHQADIYGWSSEADWSLYMFAATDSETPPLHAVGEYLEFYQLIDLTGITSISFDVKLDDCSNTFGYVSVDSAKLWNGSVAGTFYDQTIATAAFSGVHKISLGVEVANAFSGAGGWTYFDNLIAIPEPATLILLCAGAAILSAKQREHKP